MAENKDILRFLVGNESALTGNPVKRGQVYFTIDPTNPGYGNIYFDAPINASTTSRLLMGLNAKFAERATRAEQDIQQNKIDTTYISDLRLNNTGFKLEFKKPGESNWHTLPAFNFLPLTGGSVTGELYAESLTADTLLVRGNSTFIEQIRGNIDTADKWKTPIKIRVNDYGNAGVGAWRNIDGSADVTLNLPNEINATAFHGLADTAKKVEHAYKLKLNGTAQTAFDGSADVEINITPSSIGALSSGGTAIAAKKLDHNVTFQIQDYSAVHTVTPGTSSNLSSTDPIVLQLPSEIDGTVQYTKYVKSILHKSSNSTVTNNYTKFASIDISSAAWVDADCLLLVQNAEGEQPNGLLRIKARRGSTVSDATIKLQWLVLSQKAAADAVSLVKTANGKYDVYWKNYGGYQDMCFAVIKSSSSLVIIPATNISVASITPAQTSVLLGYVSNAVEAEQAVKLTTSAGSNIKPVYFSGGKPVAIDSLPWGTISNRPTIVAKSSGNPIALDAAGTTFTVYLDNGTATATSYTLAPKFLPLTGGTVTGELNADSINAGSLLVNGQARFVEQIDGTVTAAIKFANPIKLRIDDATSAHSGQDSSNIYGNETSPIVLKLPSTITAEIVGHASKDLALTGGTMTGQIKQAGRSSSWVKGRETAMIRMNAVNGYSAFASIKTDEGSWEIGAYSNSGYKNKLVFAYATDEDFTSNNNTTQNITFNSDRTITAAGFKGNADSATKWQTGRKLLVHLESPQSTGATVDGSQDVGLPVTGTLGTQNGGTGKTSWTQGKLIYSSAANTLSNTGSIYSDGSRLGVGVAVDTNYKLNTDGAIYTSSYLQVGRMFYNVVNGTLHDTSKEILIKTKIPFTNNNAMPKVSIHIRNYGQAIPEDIELVWYVWNNAFNNVGATARSSNRPYITLSKWNDGTKDYAAIGLGLIGTQVYSVYFPAVTVDFSDLWNSVTRSYATGWSIEFNTSDSTSIIPESGRVNVPYKDQSNTALKWATARTFQIQDSNGGSGGATTNVDGSNNVVLKLASTIAANISGNATSANKVNKKFTLTLGSTAQTGFDGSSPVNITITPASIGALASGGTAVAAGKWSNLRNFYVADHNGNQGAVTQVDGSASSYTLKLPQNLDSNVDAVDNFHINSAGFQYKGNKTFTYTPTADGVCYLKLTCPTTYLGEHHKFYIKANYKNIQGCVDITVFSRLRRAYISATSYNGCNVTGFYIPTSNNDIYYIRCKDYANQATKIVVYANTQITNLELIDPTHADYATVSAYSYTTVVAGAINENQVYASLNPDSAGNRDIGTSSNKWKNVYANTFNGNLSGNATTANDALRAESDKSGNNIKNTYVSDILVKNTSVTNASGTYTYPSLYRRRGNDSSTDTLISSFAPVDADGKIALKYIPFSAIERLKIVTNAAARKALTTADVQNGDVVKQTDNNQLYLVTDDTKLNSDDGYTTFSAGTAASVNWSGVNNRPHVVGHASSQTPITLDAAGTKFTVNIVTNNNGTSSYTLSPKFLPLTGGTVTGELVADSITTGSLLVNGAARFVQTIDGNIKTANKWAAPITLTVNQTGEGTANIDGSQSVTVGVTGVLPIGHGGTGASTADNARTNLSALGAKTANGYTGITTPSGDDTAWIRTTTQGILPYQSGNSSNGHGSLGTSSWYFLHAYIQNIHGSLDGNATSANKWATARNFITNLGSETQASVDGSSTSLYNLGVTGTLPMNHGGTGVTSLTANRLLYITSSKFAASGHYISSDKVAINSTSVPDHNLHVNGSTKLSRNIIRSGFYNDSDTAQSGDVVLTALGYKTGYPLCTIDPTFMVGMGGIEKYNNAAFSSTLTVNRVTYSSAGIVSPGTGSNYVIQITSTSNSTSDVGPGLGGFVQNYTSKANATYVQIFRALIPKGYNVDAHANSQGSGSKDEWLTDTSGTGKWEWYARRVICGKDGTFSNGGHIQITGGAVPITWYLSYCQCYDVTRADYDGLKVRLADQWTTSRNFSIASSGGSGVGTTVSVNGTSDVILQLPSTITATLNGSADKLDGLHATDFVNYKIFTVQAGKGIRIKYASRKPTLISASGANGNQQLILVGSGYGSQDANRNSWTELVSCQTTMFTWSIPRTSSYSCSIEIMNHSSEVSTVCVWGYNDGIITAEITALTSPAENRTLLTSANYTNYTVTKTGSGASGTWGINITGTAQRATGDSNSSKITETYFSQAELDAAKTTIRLKKPDISTWVELKPAFLPLTGGTVTGELIADSATFGSLLVNGAARFVQTIQGNIETASAWQSDTYFQIADSGGAHTSQERTTVKNSGQTYTIKLPAIITATLVGNADTATSTKTLQYANTSITTQPGNGKLQFSYTIENGTSNLFPAADNSNAIITINRHNGNYDSQLGFSSNGNLYYRKFSNQQLTTAVAWKQIVFGDGTGASGNWNINAATATGWASGATFQIADSGAAHTSSNTTSVQNGGQTYTLQMPEVMTAKIANGAILGGIDVYGTKSASSVAYSGGGFHNGYASLILHGDGASGASGIVFTSEKAAVNTTTGAVTTTAINTPSDCAFIQFNPFGVTTQAAVGTAPTLATSGESNRLVIGVNNDTPDQVWLQTPGADGLKHQVGATSYTIPGLNNTTTTANGLITSTTTAGVYTNNTKVTIDSSGNTNITGTLGVTGATTLRSTLAVTGTASFSSTGVNTMAGTFHNTNTTDSAHSKAQAALWADGGASIAKQLSAKSVRVDNGQSSKGCTVKFNETYNYVEFTFD